MRLLLWFLAVFAAASGLAVIAHLNTGNVALFFPLYRIDLSLNLFLLLLFLFFVLFYVLIRMVRNARQLPGWVASYRQQKRERNGNQALRVALKALFEGRFVQAEKEAQLAMSLPENTGCAALIGARAAHAMRHFDQRDAWLEKIAGDDAFKTARLISAVELLVDNHQTNEALLYIKELNANGTRHVQVQRWALKANQQAKNWNEVLRLVQSLDSHSAINPALSARLRELAYEDLLSAHPYDAESIRLTWEIISEKDRERPYIALCAAEAFNKVGLYTEANSVVSRALSLEWDSRLLRLYRESAAEHGSPALLAQINECEQWLAKRPADNELALTLGALCLKQKLWGKAQQYLGGALRGMSDATLQQETHLLLAELNDALSKPEEAALHYRASALASGSKITT